MALATVTTLRPDNSTGLTKNELGGSHFSLTRGLSGGQVPTVDVATARSTFAALHQAIRGGALRSCHDLSEGGLAVAAAEMAFAGGLGVHIELSRVPRDPSVMEDTEIVSLFAESNTRFLCEVTPEMAAVFETAMSNIAHARIGEVTGTRRFVASLGSPLIDLSIEHLKEVWQAPLRW